MARGRYEIIRNELGEYIFTLVTVSGRALAHSGIYKTLSVCKKGIASLRINADAPIYDGCEPGDKERDEPVRCPRIEISDDSRGGYNFAVRAKNGNVIATGEGYGTKNRCLEAIADLRHIAFSSETTEKNF